MSKEEKNKAHQDDKSEPKTEDNAQNEQQDEEEERQGVLPERDLRRNLGCGG